jgi:hypothetical protein
MPFSGLLDIEMESKIMGKYNSAWLMMGGIIRLGI